MTLRRNIRKQTPVVVELNSDFEARNVSNDKISELLNTIYSFGIKQNSVLYVYLGDGSNNKPQEISSQLPENSALVFLDVNPSIANSSSAFTIVESISATDITNKLWLLISCLKSKKVNFACDKDLEHRYADKIGIIRECCDKALMTVYHEKTSRLSKLRNSILNIPGIANSVKLKNISELSKVSAVICGAGPSIKNQFELLRANSDRVIIIAVGRMNSKLLENDIAPDFSVQVDPAVTNHIDRSIPAGTLITIPSVDVNEALKYENVIWGQGDSLFFQRLSDLIGIRLPEFKIGRTAMVTAIDFALSLGVDKVALIGSDLCIDDDGSSHIEGYFNDSVYEHQLVSVEGNNGNKVKSTPEFLNLKKAIEEYLSGKEDVYNCTEGGALIDGCLRTSFNDFIDWNKDVVKPSLLFEASDIVIKQEALFSASVTEVLDNAVHECVDELYLEMPGKGDAERKEELFNLIRNELNSDLELVAENKTEKGILKFGSFREYSINFIAKNNNNLADYLRKNNCGDVNRFTFTFNWQEPPHISMRGQDDVNHELTHNFLNMEEISRDEIIRFTKECNYGPENDAVVFIAPGNWFHPIALTDIYGECEMMIAEPFPDLLSQLIDYSMFVHRVPYNTLVVALNNAFPDDLVLYKKKINSWQENGKRVLFFRNPKTWAIDEISNILGKYISI